MDLANLPPLRSTHGARQEKAGLLHDRTTPGRWGWTMRTFRERASRWNFAAFPNARTRKLGRTRGRPLEIGCVMNRADVAGIEDRRRLRVMTWPVADTAEADPQGLSVRSKRAMEPLSSYFPVFDAAMKRPWSADDAEGNVVMVVAENRLMSERFLSRWLEAIAKPPALSSLYYGNFRGIDTFRESLARYMSRHVASKHAIGAEHLAIGNGCGAVLDTLFHILSDPGDAVFIPTPFYPTFVNDLEARCQLAVRGVPTDAEQGYFPTVEQLEGAARAAEAEGHRPSTLLLTNPANPLGTVFDARAVRAALQWAVARGVHVVSDEIYAASIFAPEKNPAFVSAWDLASDMGGAALQRVHVVWGMSKDFGVSGMRIGAVATRHAALLAAWGNLGYMTTVPSPVQEALAHILRDDAWVDAFLRDNRQALKASYEVLEAALDAEGVPHSGGGAAMFAWIDLRSALPPSPTWKDERALFDHMCGDVAAGGGVLLTPGQDCFASEPGFFRACWAASPPEAHPEAARRIAQAMRTFRASS